MKRPQLKVFIIGLVIGVLISSLFYYSLAPGPRAATPTISCRITPFPSPSPSLSFAPSIAPTISPVPSPTLRPPSPRISPSPTPRPPSPKPPSPRLSPRPSPSPSPIPQPDPTSSGIPTIDEGYYLNYSPIKQLLSLFVEPAYAQTTTQEVAKLRVITPIRPADGSLKADVYTSGATKGDICKFIVNILGMSNPYSPQQLQNGVSISKYGATATVRLANFSQKEEKNKTNGTITVSITFGRASGSATYDLKRTGNTWKLMKNGRTANPITLTVGGNILTGPTITITP